MRLGDLDALKEIFLQDRCGNVFLPKQFVISTIDNAPTVDKGYDFGYADGHGEGYELGKNSRPHGEWNYIQAGMCVCPFCGAYPHKDYKNFCPNCGANMRGKKNETDN